ncbi:hypothetical protein C8R44DRAFT_739665 [Mycena epipterygia]|nr:hypothetical protein C8R44DRAFT_739665 [Mycena epipterygia]
MLQIMHGPGGVRRIEVWYLSLARGNLVKAWWCIVHTSVVNPESQKDPVRLDFDVRRRLVLSRYPYAAVIRMRVEVKAIGFRLSMTRIFGFPLPLGKTLSEWATERCQQPMIMEAVLMELIYATGEPFAPDDWELTKVKTKHTEKGCFFLKFRTTNMGGKRVCAIDEARLAKVQALLEEIFKRNTGECKPGWCIELY